MSPSSVLPFPAAAAAREAVATPVDEPRLLHGVPGRARFSLPGWSGRERVAIEARLRALPGVKSAVASPLSGNVLLRFDPTQTSAEALLLSVRTVWRALPPGARSQSGRTEPPPRGTSEPAPPHALRERVSRGDEANASATFADSALFNGAQVVRSTRGRARVSVRGLDRAPALALHVEQVLERNAGVKAIASPLTGRVLVEFDAHRTELEELIAQIADIELPPLPEEVRPAYPLDPAPLVQSATRTLAAGLGLGLLATRTATGIAQPLPGANAAANVSSVIGIVQGFPPLRNGARRLLGLHVADLLFNGANILSLVFAGSPLGLSVSVAEAGGLLAETLARRASWKRYQGQIEALPPVSEGEPLRLEAGERAPLSGVVREGRGSAIGRDGLPRPLSPGERIESGERVQGGPLTFDPEAGPEFDPQARPAPPRETPNARYGRLLGPVSLGYALVTGLLTRSFGRGFESLLLVNPRAAVIGTEAANNAASTRVLRAGVTVVGTRSNRPIRRFDSILLDGARLLCDGVETSRTVALDGIADASELLALAAGVSAASGLPWGPVFPLAGRAPAENGAFDGRVASALIGGALYSLRALEPGEDVPNGGRLGAGELGLILSSQREDKPIALFALRARLAPGVAELVETARRSRVCLALVGNDERTRAFAKRVGLEIVPGTGVEAVRDKQREGQWVAFVSDSSEAGEAFEACDLAVGLTACRSRFRARADVLSPDVGGLTAIIEAGARRDEASRDSLGFSLLANAVGLVWGLQGGTGIVRASRAVYVAALASLGSAWLRERGGQRPQGKRTTN